MVLLCGRTLCRMLASSSGLFDVTMGSFDGAETCELVGAYLLHNIRDTHDYTIFA